MDYSVIEGRVKNVLVCNEYAIQAELKISVMEDDKEKVLYVNETVYDETSYSVTRRSIYNIDKVKEVHSIEEHLGAKSYKGLHMNSCTKN